MLNREVQPLYFLDKNPEGWFKLSLPKIKLDNHIIFQDSSQNPKAVFEGFASSYVDSKWYKKTGIEKPGDIRFSLIIPIYNEASFLSSVLGTLMMSSIPEQANVQVLLVTNGCTDDGRSEQIVRGFLEGLGEVREEELSEEILDEISDPTLDRTYRLVQKGGLSFMHFNTSRAGKANALNIANTVAKKHALIAINLDANNFVEPDAVLEMFANAHHHIVENPDGTSIVKTFPSIAFQPKKTSAELGQSSYDFARTLLDLDISDEGLVIGQFIAWDTQWVDSIGGFPKRVLEDCALGLKARMSGKKIVSADDARQWTYIPNNRNDALKLFTRIARGVFEILDKDPETKMQMRKDYHFAKSLPGRLSNLLQHMIGQPTKIPYFLASALVLEISRVRGLQEYKQDKDSETWDPIPSMKM